jgi:hypothetical protein
MAKAPAKKSAPKVDKNAARIDAIVALLRLNGLSIPAELE